MAAYLASKKLKFIISLILSLLVLVWVFAGIEWQQFLIELKSTNWPWLIVLTLIVFFQNLLRAWRWRFLLPKQTHSSSEPSILLLYNSIMLGNFASYILPLRAGEFVRPWMLTRNANFKFAAAFSSVVIERFFDLATVLFSFGLLLFHFDNLPDLVYQGASALTFVAVSILIFICLGSFWPDFILKIITRFTNFLPIKLKNPINHFFQSLLSAVTVLHSKLSLVKILLLTLLVWVVTYFYFYVSFKLFSYPPSFLMAVGVGVMVALAVAAPSAPGFVGVYQAGCLAAFLLFGLQQEQALAYSIVTHLHQYVFVVLTGVYLLFKYNLNITKLKTDSN